MIHAARHSCPRNDLKAGLPLSCVFCEAEPTLSGVEGMGISFRQTEDARPFLVVPKEIQNLAV